MVIAFVQARFGSSRLQGKIFLDFGNQTMLSTVVNRVKNSKKIDEVVVVTSLELQDDRVATYCETQDIACFRGPLQDVLARFYLAAISHGKPKIIVRITADCPFVDPSLIDSMLDTFMDSDLDYLANSAPPPGTFPDGLDIEIFTFEALQRAYFESFLPSDREHVTFYFWKSGKFKTYRYDLPQDFSHLRFTVDYLDDYRLLRNVHEQLTKINPMFNLVSLLEFIAVNSFELPDAQLRNSGWEPSKKSDHEYLIERKDFD
jgi:spore coat polysaccharide biosynthesis protein SpsF